MLLMTTRKKMEAEDTKSDDSLLYAVTIDELEDRLLKREKLLT